MLKDGIPQRRCIGCMESKDQSDLIRMTFRQGMISVDESGHAEGRGFYLCRNTECFNSAIKRKAFQRIVKGPVNMDDLESLRSWLENPDNN